MKETCSQPRIMCQSKLYLFTTKRYVLIETPLIPLKRYVLVETSFFHLQEIYVNQNTTSSSPRGMFPLGIETI
jgi:hypothetical protein